MNSKIFAYCERGTDPGFWAEPANAVSNAAFIIAAVVAFALHVRQPATSRFWGDLWLIALVGVIGVGSFLFHTFATRWAAIADVVPITVFMLAYMAYTLRRFFHASWWVAAGGLAVFGVTLVYGGPLICGGTSRCLNGSASYVPAFAALVLLGMALRVRRHPAAMALVSAGLIFAVSLTFRTLDRTICDLTGWFGFSPLGTHFMWHVLNAMLLFVLLRAAILYGGSHAPREATLPG